MTVERFYSFEQISQAVNCIEMAGELGLELNRENRCRAVWRGGENPTSVSISEKGWHDFGDGRSGSVIDLVALMEFNGDRQEAQQWIGDKFGLEPAMTKQKDTNFKTRGSRLVEKGYVLKKIYEYKDENGKVIHAVERYEHPDPKFKKEFAQRTADGVYSVKGIKTFLYRYDEWKDSKYVCITEGEKDVDTLVSMKYKATTNPSGAGTWLPEYTEMVRGKDIIIFEDNDDAGRARSQHLMWELRDHVGKIKHVVFDGEPEGSDVTDFFDRYGKNKLNDLIMKAPEIDKKKLAKPIHNYNEIVEAKKANQSDFRNFFMVSDEEGKLTPKPKHINDLAKELFRRLLKFPRRVGMTLFDHSRDTGEIEELRNYDSLFSWMMRKTGRVVEWRGGPGFVTKKEFFEAVHHEAIVYNEITSVPSIPDREDSYKSFPELPPPATDHKYFHELVDRFNPTDKANKVVLMSFLASPLWYIPGLPRPSFIIDSETGSGSGKTKIVDACAELFNTEPVPVTQSTLERNIEELTKRLISASGRSKKMVLLDNIQGQFSCPELSALITAKSISGRCAYGRGEEVRPNNLVYVITANSATVDNDLSERSMFIHVKRPSSYDAKWLRNVLAYVQEYRYNIISDMVDIIESHTPYDIEPCTRFPEFEQEILQAFCKDFNEYNEVIKTLFTSKSEANIEEELAGQITDRITEELLALNIPFDSQVFIRSTALNAIFPRGYFHGFQDPVQLIRNLSRQGFIDTVGKCFRYPHKKDRRRGIMWKQEKGKPVRVVGIDRENHLRVIA